MFSLSFRMPASESCARKPASSGLIRACRSCKNALFAGLLLGVSAGVAAQDDVPALNDARGVNGTTVGIVFHFEDYYRRLIDDMSVELAGGDDLRIVPIIGVNHVQTIYDMLFMNGVDLGVVHSDVLAYIARFQNYDAVYRLINGMVELYGERVAVIANEAYGSIEDLAGQQVNFGKAGEGSDITASLLFDALGIDVEPVRLELDDALAQVKTNSIAAHVHLLEDPVESLMALAPDDGVKLLTVPQSEELLTIYDKGELNSDDFPELITAEDKIQTLSVAVMIASYNWTPRDRFRYDKLSRFVNAFVDNFDQLKSGKHEAIWQTVSLDKEIPGAIRLPMMQKILDERQLQLVEQLAMEKIRKAEELRELRKQLVEELTKSINARLEDVDGTEQLEGLLDELQRVVEQAALPEPK